MSDDHFLGKNAVFRKMRIELFIGLQFTQFSIDPVSWVLFINSATIKQSPVVLQ
jgi:hypothetical protein